ncbi:glycosyltransferase family 4 protein [Azospirillum thermophilum]|nr:glycosyltransferase family 4 protein [Azospirillum thermophilum]
MLVNRVFPPERGATGRCLADLAGRLAAAGWQVTVLRDGRAGEGTAGGVTVAETGVALPAGGPPRARSYLDSLRRLVVRGLRLPRHDVVVTMTDPPLLALAGPLLAARHGAAAIHWCQDLYPELLPVLGIRPPVPLMRLMQGAAARAMARHDRILAIGHCMARRIAALGVAEERITVLPNWPDPRIRPVPRQVDRFRAEHGLQGRFVVAYSGNLGLAHPIAGILEAAERLATEAPEVLVLVIGEGRRHAGLTAAAAVRRLGNLRTLPLQPGERLAESLSAADLHLAAMEPDACGLLVPSKVAGALAAGRPCLFLGPAGSDAARLVAGCGAVLDPADGAALARMIRDYAGDPARCAAEGAAAAIRAAGWDADRAAARFGALAAGLLAPARSAGWRRAPHA